MISAARRRPRIRPSPADECPGGQVSGQAEISLGTVLGQLVLVQYLLRRELAARAPT